MAGGSVPPRSTAEPLSDEKTPVSEDPPHSVLGPGLTIYSFHRTKGADRFPREGERKETLSYDKDRVYTYNHFMRQPPTTSAGPFWRNGAPAEPDTKEVALGTSAYTSAPSPPRVVDVKPSVLTPGKASVTPFQFIKQTMEKAKPAQTSKQKE